MNDRLYGIDVSHHQNPSSLPWSTFAKRSSFVIVRATYGTMGDKQCAEHVRRAREVGLAIGLYHFFRPSQPVDAQLAAFREIAAGAGYAPGDIVPALDVEADPVPKPGTEVSPAWQAPVKSMLDTLVSEFGNAIVYITQREWGMLGKPAWVLERPLWVAHYTGASKPATPNNAPWLIWQHRVAPYDPDGPGGYDKAKPVLDQNRLAGPLPRVARVPWAKPETVPAGVIEDDPDEASLEDLLARAEALRAQDARDARDQDHLDKMAELGGMTSMPPEGSRDA